MADRSLDGLEVLPLLDAEGAFPATWEAAFTGATPTDWERARELDPSAFGSDGKWQLCFRCYALRSPSGSISLVDTGVGPASSPASAWAPVPGSLPDHLRAAGIEPAGVESVVLTHLHEDHTGWVVDEQGRPRYPHATYCVQSREVEWLRGVDPALYDYAVRPLEETGQLALVHGRGRLASRDRFVRGRVTLLPTPGHTPGHQSVLVESRDHAVILTGDVVVHAVQLVNPQVTYQFEADPDAAVRSRRWLLGWARRRDALLGTSHIHVPFLALGEEGQDGVASGE